MNWIILFYFLELGYSPFYQSLNVMDESLKLNVENIYYITLDSEVVILDHLFIGGAVKTYFQDQKNNKSYFPIEADYLFRAGIRIDNLELGFRHFCLHPVRPYEMYYKSQGSTDGAYEEFYIRVSNEF